MKPEQLAKTGSESGEQKALFCWAALNINKYPELKWLHHIPNGGMRGNDERTRMIVGNSLKAEGVKNGVSDISLPVRRGNFSGLYIEMKKPDLKPKTEKSKGGLSDEQIEFGKFVIEQGFCFKVCYGWEDAQAILVWYLNIIKAI